MSAFRFQRYCAYTLLAAFPLIMLAALPFPDAEMKALPSTKSTTTQPFSGDPPAGQPVAYVGARIHTAAGPVIERGVLVVVKGRIVAVGPEGKVKIPEKALVRDLTGKTIIPGL